MGTASIAVAPDIAGRTRLVSLHQSGAAKLLCPRQNAEEIEAILINTAGGVTGGDRLQFVAKVDAGAQLTLTTQAAERVYKAQPGEVGQISTRLFVETRGRLDWLPQELILFDKSALRRTLDIDLAAEAELFIVEPIVFGRAAMGETLTNITFDDRISIRQQGVPLYLDAIEFRGDATDQLGRTAIANGATAMASVVLVRADAAAMLTRIRALLPPNAGASLIAENTLVVRQLANDGFLLRRKLLPVLELLSNRELPISWRL